MTEPAYHIPALLEETLQALEIKPGGVYVDVTFGGGGHSRAILDRLGPDGRLIAFDQDEEAVAGAFEAPQFTIVHGNFRFLRNYLRFYDAAEVDGILGDLGVSFHHFDDPARGFSFRHTGALDMRMNPRAKVTAAQLLATMTAEQLTATLKLYGELPQAARMAKAIVAARQEAPVDTVERLLQIVEPMISPKQQKKELAQLFQALRIEVNDEIHALEALLRQALQSLRPGGRLAIITYHSLEDRLVKNFMRTGDIKGRESKDFYGRNLSPIKLLTPKPIVPTEAEVERNPRSRSAKLRVAVKL